MELVNVIFSEVSQDNKANSQMFSLMWITDPKQMQQYYGTLVTREAVHERDKGKGRKPKT
jgi:hypothetical protein